MSLSCHCDGDYEWYYTPADTYAPLATKRSRKCCSCGNRINVGDISVMFQRFYYAEWGTVAAKIHGEGSEVYMAPHYMCERCGDLYYSLDELGFCININDDMRDLVREYAEMSAARRGE